MKAQVNQESYSFTKKVMLELDENGNILSISKRWRHLFGDTSHQLLQQPITQIIYPESRKAVSFFIENKEFQKSKFNLKFHIEEQTYKVILSLVKRDLGEKERKITARISLDNPKNSDVAQKIHNPEIKSIQESEDSETVINKLTNRLQATQDFLDQISKTANIGGWELYLDNMHLVWTEQTYLIHDLPFKKSIDLEDAIRFYHPDYRNTIAEKVGELTKNGTEFDLKLKLITAKDREIWVRSLGKREMRAGKPYKIYGVFQDISKEIEAENILIESEEKFRLISENSGDIICIHEPDATYKYVSPSAFKVMGFRPTQLIGRNPYEFVHEEDKDTLKKESREVVINRESLTSLFRFKKADDSYIWLETVSNPIVNADKIVSIVSFSRDVTERIKKEQLLKDSRKRLKMALNTAKMGIWEWFIKEDNIVWGENLEKLHGLNKGEYDGTFKMFEKFVHPEDKEAFHNKMLEFVKSGNKRCHLIYRIIRKDGEEAWLEGIGEMYFNKKGEAIYMIGISSDITQRIIIEKDIAFQNEVIGKTNKELDNFVYRVSHDLRAPISSSIGLINLMQMEFEKEGDDNEKMQNIGSYLPLLLKSMDRMDNFIKDILDYSKNTRVKIYFEEVAIYEMINEILEQYKFANSNKNFKTENQTKPGTIVFSDKLRLNIILSNLISNSFKFYDSNKELPYIQVKVSQTSDSLVLMVKDNGIGIPSDYHDKVFDMFHRASNQEVGAGLGLYILKECVQRLNGTVHFDSEVGKGTVFTINLPIQR